MKHFNLLKTLLLLCALIVGSLSGWADEITLDVASSTGWTISKSGTSGSGSAVEMSKDGITITANKGFYDSGTSLRIYSGSSFVVTSAIGNMSKIVLTYTGGKSGPISNYNSGTNNISPASAEVSEEASGQARISQIAITYAPATSDPSISLNETSLAFGEVAATDTKQLTFAISPANLTGELSLACDNSKYTVSPTSISKDAAGAQTITVTANPTSVNDNMDGKITISGKDFADDTEVTLSTTVIRKSPALAFDPTSVTLTRGDVFTAPTFSKDAGISFSSISFSSSYSDVATVSDEGVISLGTNTGAAVVRAHFTQTDVYDEGTATCTITVNPAGVTPEPSAGGYYEKVSSDANLIDGEKYLIVNESARVALGAQNGSYRDAESVTFEQGNITEIGDATVITLVKSNDKWKLKLGDTKFYTTTTAKSMSEGDTGTDASISFDANKNVVIDFGSTPGKLYFNSGSPRFLNYTSSQTKIQLYKYVAGAAPSSIDIYVSAAGYSTYASNFDLDFTSVTNLKAYIAKEDNGAIKMVQVNKVPKGTGILLRATDGGDKKYSVPTATTTDDVTGNLFVRGNDEAVASENGSNHNYILNVKNNQLGFYKANGNTVAKNRAYLQTTVAASRINLNFDEETTGIAEVKTNVKSDLFNINGQRVEKTAKGLYIMNGKKFIVK